MKMAACFLYWNFRENEDKPLRHERVSDKESSELKLNVYKYADSSPSCYVPV